MPRTIEIDEWIKWLELREEHTTFKDRLNTRFFIDTGPDPEDVTHEAATMRKRKGSQYGGPNFTVSLCGVTFQPGDSWALGFGSSDEHAEERVNCPQCKEIAAQYEPYYLR
jgi:hypothetical protein